MKLGLCRRLLELVEPLDRVSESDPDDGERERECYGAPAEGGVGTPPRLPKAREPVRHPGQRAGERNEHRGAAALLDCGARAERPVD